MYGKWASVLLLLPVTFTGFDKHINLLQNPYIINL